MPEGEKREQFFKKERASELEPSDRLKKIRKGLEVNLVRLEADPEEKEGKLLKDERFERLFPNWKEDFWEAEKEYAEIPQPKSAVEQTFIWNSGQAPLEGRIMDGFKQFGRIIMDRQGLEELEELKKMKVDDAVKLLEKRATEIIVVDRKRDRELVNLCKWARMLEDWKKDEEERVFMLAGRVREIMGGMLASEETIKKVEKRREKRKEVFLGDIKYGISQHRALLFQVLAKEAGIEFRMLVDKDSALQYNQVFLKSGQIAVIDTTWPSRVGDKHFDELNYQEFKEKGGFPLVGSNKSSSRIYREPLSGRVQGGWFGADGLRELLKK